MDTQGQGSFVPGMVIGRRYELIRVVRSEAHGKVMLARDQALDVEVGLKCLSNEVPEFDRLLEYYRREALTGMKLHHPQILGIHHLDETEEGVFLVQEPFAGNSLWELLGQSEALTINDSLYFIEVLAQGVAYIHKQGVIHQNFNPQQVLVSATEGIKIINLAFPTELAEIQAYPDLKAYIAPEVWQGRKPLAASNIFSLSVIGYRMLTGALPFPMLTDEIMPYQAAQQPLDLERIPESLQPLFLRGLHPDPGKRFPAATDFLSQLSILRERLAITGPSRKKRPEEEGLVAVTGGAKAASRPPSGAAEPVVEIDSDWQAPEPIPRRSYWEQMLAWLQEQQHRLTEYLGPEPLRLNRHKQLAAGVGGFLTLLLLIYALSSLFLPKPRVELAQRPESGRDSAPAIQAPLELKPAPPVGSPGPPQEIQPESTISTTSPPASVHAPVIPPGSSLNAPVVEKTKPQPSVASTAAKAKTLQTATKSPARPKSPVKAQPAVKTPKTAMKLAATYDKPAEAAKYANTLSKQGKRTIVKKVVKGKKTFYQVWVNPAAGQSQQAATAAKPKTAAKTGVARPH